MTIDGVPHTVVGIAPDDFRGHFHFFQAPGSLLFIPLERHPRLKANPNLRDDRTVDWVRIHGRLDPGVDITRANALVSATVAGLAQRYPASNEFKAATVEPYASHGCGRSSGVATRVQRHARPGGSGAPDRVPEHLGHDAGPRRQPRARAVASARRSARAGDVSSSICSSKRCCWRLPAARSARLCCSAFPPSSDGGWARRCLQEIDLDAAGVAISSGLCLLVSVLFGLLPAVRFSRPNLIPALKEDAGGGGRQTIRVHRVAAMVQIGIAIPFLVISGVMLDRVRTADFGFPTDGLAAARLPAPRRPGARGRLLHPEGSRQSPAGQRRALGGGGRGHADRLRLPGLSRRQHEWSGVCHGARHARRRKLSRDHRRAAAARSDDHGRGPHHGGAGRGDFRTARRSNCFRAPSRLANG